TVGSLGPFLRNLQLGRSLLQLGRSLFHLKSKVTVPLFDRANPPPVAERQEGQNHSRAEGAKPVRLVISWSNGKLEHVALLVPHTAVIARDHTKPVGARSEIRILDLAFVYDLPPLRILPLQFETEMDSLPRHHAKRG